MTESANTSEKPGLLSARNAIFAAIAVLVLSVLGSCVSMLRPPDSGGLRRDSFGTRHDGYRALIEILHELDISVTRDLAPPQPRAGDDHTLVMLDPDAHLVDHGPKYVAALLAWVDQGGRLVVTPSRWRSTYFGTSAPSDDEESAHNLLEILDVDNAVKVLDLEDNGTEYLEAESESYVATGSAPPRVIPIVKLTGSLAELEPITSRLSVPGDGFGTLEPKIDKVSGSLTVKDSDDQEHVVVTTIPRGKGEIVVVSDAQLFTNANIARADNSVIATHLLAPGGRPVVIDEFYHGLAVRGNPLFLLTRPGFAAVTLGLLICVGVWAWRSAVFLGPPLVQSPPSRRDIGQYIDAMGDFFARGPDHRRFVAREIRDGVLHQLCEELKLPADTTNVDTILAALRRRNPQRADRLSKLLVEVDHTLAGSGEFPRSEFLPTMQRLAGSL
jgi:hypothetical protein